MAVLSSLACFSRAAIAPTKVIIIFGLTSLISSQRQKTVAPSFLATEITYLAFNSKSSSDKTPPIVAVANSDGEEEADYTFNRGFNEVRIDCSRFDGSQERKQEFAV